MCDSPVRFAPSIGRCESTHAVQQRLTQGPYFSSRRCEQAIVLQLKLMGGEGGYCLFAIPKKTKVIYLENIIQFIQYTIYTFIYILYRDYHAYILQRDNLFTCSTYIFFHFFYKYILRNNFPYMQSYNNFIILTYISKIHSLPQQWQCLQHRCPWFSVHNTVETVL